MRYVGADRRGAAGGGVEGDDGDERRGARGDGRAWIQRDFSWKGIGAQMKVAYEWLLTPEKVEKPEWVVSD